MNSEGSHDLSPLPGGLQTMTRLRNGARRLARSVAADAATVAMSACSRLLWVPGSRPEYSHAHNPDASNQSGTDQGSDRWQLRPPHQVTQVVNVSFFILVFPVLF